MLLRSATTLVVLILCFEASGCRQEAQKQTPAPNPKPLSETAAPAAASPATAPPHASTASGATSATGGRVWLSEVSGKEYRVWSDAQGMQAEWVNVPSELAERGAFIKTIFHHQGSKWVGTAHSYLPCTVGAGTQEHIANWCHVRAGMEIRSMSIDRIVGRGEALARFDCQKCQVLGTVWKDFAWVPKEKKK